MEEYYCEQCGILIEEENAYSIYGVNGVFCSLSCMDKYNRAGPWQVYRWARGLFARRKGKQIDESGRRKRVMFVARVVLQGDGIRSEVLLSSGTRIQSRLREPSARVYEAIEVIEAEILMRLREELGLPSAAEESKPTEIAVCQTFVDGTQCTEPAQWVLGTWQFCDKHARRHLHVFDGEDILDPEVQERMRRESTFGGSDFGTAARIGQEAILEHCKRYGVNLRGIK